MVLTCLVPSFSYFRAKSITSRSLSSSERFGLRGRLQVRCSAVKRINVVFGRGGNWFYFSISSKTSSLIVAQFPWLQASSCSICDAVINDLHKP